ncbi:apoptosis-stimulating of p53 protein 2 isoform X2 [Nasonia vitripennis]|uniref:SH3 domain-containing protein n=1 Tax=Nasonia vitripennis TaxID=7425 RepID=A0A7M7T656_NASVI|nr:apoptosis-stimulating of p53 protein 2 isoform X2 [Nasonia vitripennis]XP_032451961.1 apoptosis-stimulating of p53 protein 2 isoform X2 [Nasonia vitripennis]
MLACVYPAESFKSKAVTVKLRQQHTKTGSKRRPKLLAVKERSAQNGQTPSVNVAAVNAGESKQQQVVATGSGNNELPVGGGGAVLVLSELESMASRQQREIAQQRRLLEQREARLAVLRSAQEPAQQDRLARLRHRLDQQQSKLNRLRQLRSQTDSSRATNVTLTYDLDNTRKLFNEKEKELSLAVAKVDELTRQLEELRGRHVGGAAGGPGSTGANGHLGTPASAELEKLRRELLYRNKMNEQQNQVVSQQRLALAQRQAEMASIDARIAQLQGRLQRKRALNQRLSQQLAQQHQQQNSPTGHNHPANNRSSDAGSNNAGTGNSPKLEFGLLSGGVGKPRPAGNIAAIEPYSHIPNDNDFSLNKNDPKYQTLPYNTKFTVNFKTSSTTNNTTSSGTTANSSDDDVNKNKIQHSASASQIGTRATNFGQFGHQIAHSQSQSHIQGQSQPLNSNQTQQQNLNNNNVNNNNNNNNNNTANHNYQSAENNQSPVAQTIRLLQQHQQQHQQKAQQQQHGSTSSSTSSISSSQNQNHRNLQTHQKPVSSVAPSFPVKSPIYQTSSTKIHPVMPQTLSLIGRGHSAAQNQNGRDPGMQNGQQQQQDSNFASRHNYPSSVSQQQQQGGSSSGGYQSQNSPNLPPPQSSGSSFPGYGYSQTAQLDERLKIPDKLAGLEQQQQTRFEQQQVKYEPHGQPIKLYDQSAGGKHEQTSKLQQQQQLEHNSQGFKQESQQQLQQFKSEQNQSKFEHLAARYEQQQQHVMKHDHNVKFEPPINKLPEKPFDYERKTSSGEPLPAKPEMLLDKTKPALPPKPSKPNPPPRLTQHHEKIEVAGELGDSGNKPSVRVEKEEETIPPIPTSEPPESPTESQLPSQQQLQHQVIKARPLSLKKAPLSEQPKLRYAKSNVHVSINRRIEMPPAFLFPETEIPADLMQTEQQQQQQQQIQQQQQTVDVTDSNSLKRLIVSPVTNEDITCNEKLEDSDIVDALNVLNIEEQHKLKSDTIEIEGGKPAADVIRRKKGNLKSTTGKANLSRRVSFDPLALLLDASLEGELELVKKTAKEVANPSSANDEGITALHNAICAGHLEIVKFLVEFGCDVNAQDSDGWTPLHCAASCNNQAMVRFLVEHGACIFATTLSDQETAAEKCEEDEEGFDGCSEYLYSVQEKLGIMNNGQVFAVFDYDAQHSDELSLKNGDSLVILRKGDDNERDWWWSKLGHREGYVPRNLLGLYPRVQPAKAD